MESGMLTQTERQHRHEDLIITSHCSIAFLLKELFHVQIQRQRYD